MFGRRVSAGSVNGTATEYPREAGFPNDHFDFPYQVVTNDAVSITATDSDGIPQPYEWEAPQMGATPEWRAAGPEEAGAYALDFMDAPAIMPTYSPIQSGPGSVDLAVPYGHRDFAPGRNRLIHSTGPVDGAGSNFTGDVAEIGRETPGQGGPVTGGTDYGQQLAATYWATQAQQYSQQAAASALVSAV